MPLLDKLLDYVHQAFNRSADGMDMLFIRTTDTTLRITKTDTGLLFTESGDTETLAIEFDGLTVQDVFDQINAVYETSFIADYELTDKAARILLKPRRFRDSSEGDYVWIIAAYQSPLWAILDMFGDALATARADIEEAILQLYLHESEEYWLDEYGSYFGVPPVADESDDEYRRRIIAEIIKPKCNNFSIELAVQERFQQDVSVTDITARPTWFDVTTAFDLLGSESPATYLDKVAAFINKVKAAGTKFDSITLVTPDISDTLASSKVSDRLELTVYTEHYLDGKYFLNGENELRPSSKSEVV